jgi:RimJ/RimL family protein N-acetyltransferase
VFLRTARLTLRRFTAADVDLLVELDSDPEVMRYLTGGKPTQRDVIEQQLAGLLAEYERSGLGWFAAETTEFVGWMGLRPVAGEVELGYRLRRAAWGRGLATEGCRALIACTDGTRRVFAQTMAVNVASRRVMERLGMVHVRTFFPHFNDPIPGTDLGEVEYELWPGGSGGPP